MSPLSLWIWIDSARVLRRGVVAIEEGEPIASETFGEWFPCRLPPKTGHQTFGDRHHSLEDRREMSAMVTPASDVLSEADRLEIMTQDGERTEWEVERCTRPRNGQGEILLLVADVVRREQV